MPSTAERSRSGQPGSSWTGLDDVEVTVGIAGVLPLLVEDHVHAMEHCAYLRRVTRSVGGDTYPLELLCRERGHRLFHHIHAPATDLEHFHERGARIGGDPETGGIRQP